jgi:hypothetical protein
LPGWWKFASLIVLEGFQANDLHVIAKTCSSMAVERGVVGLVTFPANGLYSTFGKIFDCGFLDR